MNKIPICFIVIDDDPTQKDIIEKEVLKKLGEFEIFHKFYNPKDYMVEIDEDFKFDIIKFVKKIDDDTKGKSINLIAIDYNLSTNELKGIDIVNILKCNSVKNFKNCQFLIHSATIDEASRRILQRFDDIKKEKDKSDNDDLISEINSLIESKIQLTTKGKYPSEIVKILRENISTKSIIINSLGRLELVSIEYGNENFDGKNVSQLIDLIEKDDTLGQRFIQEFIELAIAHFGKINE